MREDLGDAVFVGGGGFVLRLDFRVDEALSLGVVSGCKMRGRE